MVGTDGRAAPRPKARLADLEKLVVATFALFGWRVGLTPLADNSEFVHLRTGIELARTGHIPRADPYSFTALGHPWVVQSWLASAVYGLTYRAGGALAGTRGQLHAVLILEGLVTAALAAVVARLAVTGHPIRTMLAASVAVFLGAVYWSPRPLLFGLLALALTVTVVERRLLWLWLVPIGWIWVNTHGSFPLGALWLGAAWVGSSLDVRRIDREFRRYALGLGIGLLSGALNPLGPRLLVFPLTVAQKTSAFKTIVEWQSPNFQTRNGVEFLALLAVALVIIARSALPWRYVLPVVAFLALALLSLRNVSPAAVVLAPALGRALRPERQARPAAAGAPDPLRRILHRGVSLALVVITVAFLLNSFRGSGLDLRTYPVDTVAWMKQQGLLDPARHRVAEQDVVGCYLILLNGPRGRVFVDDRVDMYPAAVSTAYDEVLGGAPDSAAILSRYGVDTVLWDKRLSLPAILEGAGWHRLHEDQRWVLLAR